jgi:hypothetical protein
MRGRGSGLGGKESGKDDGMEVRDENVLEKKSREGTVPGVRNEKKWLEKIGVLHGLLYLEEDT